MDVKLQLTNIFLHTVVFFVALV